MPKISKRMQAVRQGVDPVVPVAAAEAIALLKERSKVKFDETLEICMNLGIDPRHADQMLRGMVQLPNGTGKSVRVAVFARGDKATEASEAGAEVVGSDELVQEIQQGRMDFDRVVATPDMMPLVGRLGKILGPRGLMPNPKLGTVTQDVAGAIKAAKGGSVEFRADRSGVVHAGVGKVSFDQAALLENVRAFVEAIQRNKPSGAKGTYIKKVTLSTTMGPGVRVDPGSVESRDAAAAA